MVFNFYPTFKTITIAIRKQYREGKKREEEGTRAIEGRILY